MSRLTLVSDFNIDNLATQLRGRADDTFDVQVAPYGQVLPTLLDASQPCWTPTPDVAVVWTRPEGVIQSFQKVLSLSDPDLEAVLEEVDQYADALLGVKERARCVMVPTWVVPPYHRGLGLLDLRPGGLAWTVHRMNARLVERLGSHPGFFPFDTTRWLTRGGFQPGDAKFWYMAKIPFGLEVFKRAAEDIRAALTAVSGRVKKAIVLDLDDTLWGGIVGEVGWEGLKLGGHDPIGEAFVEFQKALKALQRRGVVLAIASKNDEAVALDAIDQHPEMVLRRDDFVAWRIHWGDKAQSIAEIADELNLKRDSFVFIDDNPAERGRVREALPDLYVPDWPADKMLYPSTLLSLECFDSTSRSAEDAQRTRMYVADRERRDFQAELGSVEDWLRSLDLKVIVEPLNPGSLTRATQLLNRTNQMNLSTRRLTASELSEFAAQEGQGVWTLRVSDRFGDSGLTGLVSAQRDGTRVRVVDFVLSCRVFGRHIEEVMLHVAVRFARSLGATEVEAVYLPTEKNKPCLEFLRKSGLLEQSGSGTFIWDATKPYEAPDFILVEEAATIGG